jgi:transcriptional regulator with XRE-family HTH domain
MAAGESQAAFARRLGITDQHISNYVKGTYDVGPEVLAQIAGKLSDHELLYVVDGRNLGSPEAEAAAFATGVRYAIDSAMHELEAIGQSVLSREVEAVDILALLESVRATRHDDGEGEGSK